MEPHVSHLKCQTIDSSLDTFNSLRHASQSRTRFEDGGPSANASFNRARRTGQTRGRGAARSARQPYDLRLNPCGRLVPSPTIPLAQLRHVDLATTPKSPLALVGPVEVVAARGGVREPLTEVLADLGEVPRGVDNRERDLITDAAREDEPPCVLADPRHASTPGAGHRRPPPHSSLERPTPPPPPTPPP